MFAFQNLLPVFPASPPLQWVLRISLVVPLTLPVRSPCPSQLCHLSIWPVWTGKPSTGNNNNRPTLDTVSGSESVNKIKKKFQKGCMCVYVCGGGGR